VKSSLAPAIAKACGATSPQSAVFDAAGLNMTPLATECSDDFGIALTDLASYSACLGRQHECLAEQLLRFEAPTAEGLLRLVAQVKSPLCPGS
jgi:hypothetical protein